MQDRDLHARILGLAHPWHVVDVQLDTGSGEIRVKVAAKANAEFAVTVLSGPWRNPR